MCLKQSDTKQTETSELEQRKVYCRAKQGKWVAHAQNPQTPQLFGGEKFLIGKIWGEGCKVCDFLLIGWW